MSRMLRKKNVKGFTVVELTTVFAVLGLLATIAIPNYLWYVRQARNVSAEADAKNAYTVAQSYFNDYPEGSISSIAMLAVCGFRQTTDVSVSASGAQETLSIVAYHSAGDKTYTVDNEGAMHE